MDSVESAESGVTAESDKKRRWESHELDICEDCQAVIANGELPGNTRWDLTAWGEAVEVNWPNAEGWQLVNGEGDGEGHFSRWGCDCCGSTLAGQRYPGVAMRRAAQ